MGDDKMAWRRAAEAKLESINNSIPQNWRIEKVSSPEQQRDITNVVHDFLSRDELEITGSDAVEIVRKTSSGQWKAGDVTKSFCHRASIAHQLTNCLHETFFDAAIESAARLDKHFAEIGAPIGPLHGLPISLKDQFHVKGVETCMGYVGWIGTFEGKKGTGLEMVFESELVKELRAAGAVLYCKTSVPHSLMTGETVNNIIGYTTNPKNRNLTSGGSSGGEGALIGLHGSPVGFGTDIGGSVRIPAAFNGLYGIRPSAGRLPYEGMANSMDGQNSILSVVGPMSHSVASLRLVMRACLSQQPWLHDPLCLELPWRADQEQQIQDILDAKKPLVFGVMLHDGYVVPHPPVRRAVKIVQQTMEQLGHHTMSWTPPSHKRGVDIVKKTWSYDGGLDIHNALGLSGEPIAPQVASGYGDKAVEQANATAIAATNVAQREYQKEYMEYWNSTVEMTMTGRPVDAIIMPVAPFAAARREKFMYYGYSSIFNVLDYTACVVPVTNVDQDVDSKDVDFEPVNELDRQNHDAYDAELYDGAHVAVQVVCRRLQDEKALMIAEHIGKALRSG